MAHHSSGDEGSPFPRLGLCNLLGDIKPKTQTFDDREPMAPLRRYFFGCA
jgi:hypothetical protein